MKIKVIWDFRGEDGLQTAKHHAIHLKEFCEKEKILNNAIDYSKLSEFHAIAYVIVDKENVNIIRDSLKPHRAEIVSK